jgi:hypothetical protein
MQLSRKVDLSVYYYVKDYLETLTDLVTVVDGYPVDYDGSPDGELVLPTVAVERRPIKIVPYQLGGPSPTAEYSYSLDVFAKTKAQCDDIAYMLQAELDDNNIAVYDYDEGFPPDVSPTQIGALILTGPIENRRVYVFPEITPLLYWRAVVDFMGYYTT